MRIALATAASLPSGDADDVRLPEVLGAEWRVWDDPAVDWAAYDLVLVRSVWDYFERRDRFLEWAEAVERASRLYNPAAVLRWNTDKRYLAELADAGVPVVPTSFVSAGDPVELPAAEVVVKPAVSAGARDTGRHTDHRAARAHVERIVAGGGVAMVQPYLHEVDKTGETGLLYFGGRFSHGFRKGALLEADAQPRPAPELAEDIGPRDPTAAEHAVAERVLAHVRDRFGTPAYARVDLLPAPSGPVVIELEATEPSLWFRTTRAGEERLRDGLARVAQDLL